MQKFRNSVPGRIIGYLPIILILIYIILQAQRQGADVNVYLYAAKMLDDGRNIYEWNPFNNYLYSPLFAFLLWPLSHFSLLAGRLIWAAINVLILYRLYRILRNELPDRLALSKVQRSIWIIGLIIISAVTLNHNLILGQITLLILWLTLEGVIRIMKRNELSGSALLALGISIKIIPAIALGYLLLKRKFKAAALVCLLTGIYLFIPAAFIGIQQNNFLLKEWKTKMNPESDKYLFERANGCNSMNAILPAFFYDFDEFNDWWFGDDSDRKITLVDHDTLKYILHGSRILLLLSVIPIVFIGRQKNENRYIRWLYEISYLMLVSMLVFPHQMKYTILYFVPAGSYLLLYIIQTISKWKSAWLSDKMLSILIIPLLLSISITGRDLIGKQAAYIMDYYHIMGLAILGLLIIMHFVKPGKIVSGQ